VILKGSNLSANAAVSIQITCLDWWRAVWIFWRKRVPLHHTIGSKPNGSRSSFLAAHSAGSVYLVLCISANWLEFSWYLKVSSARKHQWEKDAHAAQP